jgi:hypothetical protein
MGSSMHVVGFRPPDEMWRRMKKVWDACIEAGIPVPPTVDAFFEGLPPDPAGVHISEATLTNAGAASEWADGMCEGHELDLTKIPPGVTIIRFYNSH